MNLRELGAQRKRVCPEVAEKPGMGVCPGVAKKAERQVERVLYNFQIPLPDKQGRVTGMGY